jgi:hypothetical protein
VLAVGANGDDSNATGINGDSGNTQTTDSGAAHIYARSNGVWSHEAYIKASNTGPNDRFGAALDLSADGSTLVVAAKFEDSSTNGINGNYDNNSPDAGAAYVFAKADNAWTQQAYVKASNSNGGDNFGQSVAVSTDGNTLVVGAWNEDSTATGVGGEQASEGASNAGAAYVYFRSGSNWTQQAYLKASNTDSLDHFGAKVTVSGDGDTIVVAAPDEDSSATGIDGGQGDDSALSSGAVYVFVRINNAWGSETYIKASSTNEYDGFGSSVALSSDGNMLVVGARTEDSATSGLDGPEGNNTDNSGAAYLFLRANNEWTQRTYVKASNTEQTAYTGDALALGDNFGSRVALSGDGNTLVVASEIEASAATGVSGDQADDSAAGAGAVYVY